MDLQSGNANGQMTMKHNIMTAKVAGTASFAVSGQYFGEKLDFFIKTGKNLDFMPQKDLF